jgi:hypothetical protein
MAAGAFMRHGDHSRLERIGICLLATMMCSSRPGWMLYTTARRPHQTLLMLLKSVIHTDSDSLHFYSSPWYRYGLEG